MKDDNKLIDKHISKNANTSLCKSLKSINKYNN